MAIKREDTDPKYRWRLEDIFESDDAWNAEFREAEEGLKILPSFRGKIAASSDGMYEYFTKRAEETKKLERLYGYASMRRDENTANTLYQGMTDKALKLIVTYESELAFATPEMLTIPQEELEKRAAEERFADHRFELRKLERSRAHILSEKEEKLLAMVQEPLEGASSIFNMLNNVDLKFGEVTDAEGKKTELTHGTYSVLLKDPDRNVRKQAYEKLYGAYGSMKNTISTTYATSVKTDVFAAKARNFDGALEAALYGNNVPVSVYEELIEAVHEKLPALHKYISLRKEVLGLEQLEMYDLYTPLLPECNMSLDYEQAKVLVKDALKPLGENYQKLLDKAYTEGWIDVYENEGKRSGAYSNSVYGTHPYVLLNHQNDVDHASTLAHELGHAMHTYHSMDAQPYETADYCIMVAEVASTVNEMLLTRYLVGKETDKKKKAYLLNDFLETVRATCYRQTMFAEFELKVHRMCESGEPLTVDSMSKVYKELNELYYKGVHVDDNIAMEWMRIPHFYRAFYVYQYATGICTALALVNNILEKGELDRYIAFLSSGGSDYPIKLLQNAGVDLTDKNTVLNALDTFEKTVDELAELLKED